MSYDLSFSPEFFYGEGDPYDGYEVSDRPTNVMQAIISTAVNEPEYFENMVLDNFPKGADMLAHLGLDDIAFAILEKIQDTNTCGTLTVPVDVWVDPEGNYTIDVW